MVSDNDWTPDPAKLWVEPDVATGRAMMIRHPTHPFTDEWNTQDKSELLGIAHEYLARVGHVLVNPSAWRTDRMELKEVGWLPISPPDRDASERDPRNSFFVERYADAFKPKPAALIDETAILLGRISFSNDVPPLRVRVVAHIRRGTGKGPAQVCITGVSLSAAEDAGWYQQPQWDISKPKGSTGLIAFGAGPAPDERQKLLVQLSKDANEKKPEYFAQDRVSTFGLKAANDVRPNRPTLLPSAELQAKDPGIKATVERLLARRHAYASRGGTDRPLEDGNVRVTNSPFAKNDKGKPRDDTKEVPASTPSDIQRTDESMAVNAFDNARELFWRLTSYGFVPKTYLKFANPQIVVRYRSGIEPGPGRNGKTINAEADWMKDARPEFQDSTFMRGTIEIRYALGDLELSPARAPLGVACDPRWNWHEFSHALLLGTTGAPEPRFSHGGGDALAAIRCDPNSELAKNESWRGVTFPWIYLPRRHDRDVNLGWGWSGSMYQRERFSVSPEASDKDTYWSEQILSTTLFRLYRAIGGDKKDDQDERDVEARKSAADYAMYLIMRAYALLGPAKFVPARTPDQFVSALIDADVGTEVFGDPDRPRVGGTIHKVIRWAFERQGLYTKSADGFPVNKAGEPEPVDIYIDDGREGHYGPVDPEENSDYGRRDATTDAIKTVFNGNHAHTSVYVSNRGDCTADKVEVRVWVAELDDANGPLPGWLDERWKELKMDSSRKAVAPGSTPTEFGSFRWPTREGVKFYALLAAASCPADRSNIDNETGLPCARTPGPIEYLVLSDNNLGLRKIPVQQ